MLGFFLTLRLKIPYLLAYKKMTDDILICIAYSLKVQTLRVILNFHFLLKIESRKHGNILAVARSELSCYVF